MELIRCRKCKGLLSDKARTCPTCGFPVIHKKEVIVILNILTISVLIAWSWFYWSNLSSNERSEVMQVIKMYSRQPVILYDREVKVPKDQFVYIPVNLEQNATVTIEYKVKSGPMIDAIFMDLRDFKAWQKIMDNDYETKMGYIEYLSSFGIAKSNRTLNIPAGSYYMVINNTDFSPISSRKVHNEPASLNIKISVKYN